MELLSQCEYCSSFANVEVQNRQGAYIKFRATCTNRKCGHSRYWENSEKLGERPLINILISAAVLFSGSLPAKFLRAMNTLCVMCPSPATFFDHQKTYLHGVSMSIAWLWARVSQYIYIYIGFLANLTCQCRTCLTIYVVLSTLSCSHVIFHR